VDSLLESTVQSAIANQKSYIQALNDDLNGNSTEPKKNGENGLYYSTDAVTKAKEEEQARLDDALVSAVMSTGEQTDGDRAEETEAGTAHVEYPPLTEAEEEGLIAAADRKKEDRNVEQLENVEKGILLSLLIASGVAALLVLGALLCMLAHPRPRMYGLYPVCLYPSPQETARAVRESLRHGVSDPHSVAREWTDSTHKGSYFRSSVLDWNRGAFRHACGSKQAGCS
jgi:hypothetical protein